MGPNRVGKEILANMAVSIFKKENYFEIIVDSQEVVKKFTESFCVFFT